ncbi:ATP-binding cassette domain-containing protein [Pseudonocardia sp.]|jgi:ABC-type branched-subunit amino acid transport system ATPase component/ABC-type branched-subunit amino acid transport system permease subunit|uniref:branched-chain amino acid ABC transporter ATP-binding protein/permease n=1 Tax=Pseudonocardia sp. TaxID=60912 RepID=UPI003D11F31C
MNLASWLSMLQFGIVYALFALSLYASLSTGVLSVAPISSGAIGGFLLAALAAGTGVPAFVVLVAGGVAGGAFGYLLSYLFGRLNGHYLAMATIALLLITNVLVLNATPFTGGVNGIAVPQWYGWGYLVGTLALFAYVFARMRGSRLGLAAAVVREDPLVAAGIGINPAAIQRIGFLLGGLLGGVAGVLLANLLRYIDPSTFYVHLAFVSLAAVVLGGAYRWPGAIIGGLVFTALPQMLDRLVPSSVVQIIYGILIIVIMIFLPKGLYDPALWRRATGLLPSRKAPAEPAGVAPTAPSPAAPPPAAPSPVAPSPVEDAVRAPRADTTSPAPTADDDVAAVETHGVTKVFGGLNAVDDFTVRVPRGSIFGVLGPNGAGKTTVINLLSGVLPVDSGEITLFGTEVTGQPAYERARRGLARTYQNIRLSPGLTTLETIMAGGFVRGSAGLLSIVAATPAERRERRELAEQARELMSAVGLTTPPELHAETLSYGDQRRVEIARALASRPSVLLLDEPTAGMNYTEASAVGDLLREIVAQGMTVILIEHNMRLVIDYCDSCVVMQSGRLLAEGDPAECLAGADVQEAYFGRRGDAERVQALRFLRADPSS